MREKSAKRLSAILDDRSMSQKEIETFLLETITTPPTVEEILGYIDAMRDRMIPVNIDEDAIDVCGTGGDGKNTFNISTCAAIILAAGDVPVIKHGNRAASSNFGSADVLEQLHLSIPTRPERARAFFDKHNFVFLFAPHYHPSLKQLANARKSLGKPTIFNLLGPLLNPAGVRRQVIGTYSYDNAQLLAGVAQNLNYDHLLVLSGRDGLDEASPAAMTDVFEIKGNVIKTFTIQMTDFNLEPTSLNNCRSGTNAKDNAQIVIDCLQPNKLLTPKQRMVIYNAGIGFYVSGKADSIMAGVQLARGVVASGRALQKLEELQK